MIGDVLDNIWRTDPLMALMVCLIFVGGVAFLADAGLELIARERARQRMISAACEYIARQAAAQNAGHRK